MTRTGTYFISCGGYQFQLSNAYKDVTNRFPILSLSVIQCYLATDSAVEHLQQVSSIQAEGKSKCLCKCRDSGTIQLYQVSYMAEAVYR